MKQKVLQHLLVPTEKTLEDFAKQPEQEAIHLHPCSAAEAPQEENLAEAAANATATAIDLLAATTEELQASAAAGCCCLQHC